VLQARAEAAHAVARARCGGLKDSIKSLCLQHAQAVEAQALADATPMPPVAAARSDGARPQRAVVERIKPAAAPFKAMPL
jgi:hypothetical protein